MPTSHLYLSLWRVVPMTHPSGLGGGEMVEEFSVDARTGQGAIDKMIDIHPQYYGLPCVAECVIEAKYGRKA